MSPEFKAKLEELREMGKHSENPVDQEVSLVLHILFMCSKPKDLSDFSDMSYEFAYQRKIMKSYRK